MANLSIKQVLTNLGKDILNWVKSNCVNNLVSDATNLPLSAAQGKVLQDQITALNSNIVVAKTFQKDITVASKTQTSVTWEFSSVGIDASKFVNAFASLNYVTNYNSTSSQVYTYSTGIRVQVWNNGSAEVKQTVKLCVLYKL